MPTKEVVSRRAASSQPLSPADQPRLDWAASGWAGFVGGIALIALQSLLLPLSTEGSHGDAVRMISGIATGVPIVPEQGFRALVVLGAAAIHLPLSLLYARLLCGIVHRWHPGAAVAFGALFGAALYAVNYHGFTALFPWFAAARGWGTIAAHVAFGAIAAATYKELVGPRRIWGHSRYMGRDV